MARIVFFITFLGLFYGILGGNAGFATESPYAVKGIQVDIQDESAVKARNKAFIEAQKKAFLVLAERYVSTDEVKTLKVPSEETLSGFIQDFKIASEQVSTKRYVGVFDFRFKSSAVNAHFGHGPLNFVSNPTVEYSKILLLPFYYEEQKDIVFNKKQNPFWTSLSGEIANYPTIILPEGNIQDLTDVGDKGPTGLSATSIQTLLARYDVKLVMVAMAQVSLKDQSLIAVELFDANNLGAGSGMVKSIATFDIDPKKAASVTLDTVAKAMEIALKPQTLQLIISEDDKPKEPENLIPESEINPESFIPSNQRGRMPQVERLRMIDRAKREQIQASNGIKNPRPAVTVEAGGESGGEGINPDNPSLEANEDGSGEIKVQVFFNAMDEWIQVQKDMSKLDGITGIRIVSLKTNQAETVIEYYDWGRLLASLKTAGMTLYPASSNTYVLKRVSDNF